MDDFLVLLIAWASGLPSGYTLGNFVHVLLVIALMVPVFQLLSGGRSLPRETCRSNSSLDQATSQQDPQTRAVLRDTVD